MSTDESQRILNEPVHNPFNRQGQLGPSSLVDPEAYKAHRSCFDSVIKSESSLPPKPGLFHTRWIQRPMIPTRQQEQVRGSADD